MKSRALIALMVTTAFAVALPAVASAQTLPSAAEYDLSFTLPTAGMSGCTVCHGDPNLVRATAGSAQTLFVDQTVLDTSAHANTLCTGCHIDFAFKTPHENLKAVDQWRDIAKAACKGCHAEQFQQMSLGAHTYAPSPGVEPTSVVPSRKADVHTPLCGDCHGSHSIATSSTAGYREWQASGFGMCGGECHEEAETYADYWHGEAYRNGAPDAPTCWDCHGAHTVLPSDDIDSPTNERNLVATCQKCHPDADETYVQYAELIHTRAEQYSKIPFYDVFNSARLAIASALASVTARF